MSVVPFGDAAAVYANLGRYTHRVGISNARLLLHVLPKGFVRIRHYGLLAPGGSHVQEAKSAHGRNSGSPNA